MKAITLRPGIADSAALREVDGPEDSDGTVLVETIAVGICGTDAEILRGDYGEVPPGEDFLILGHESLGRVMDAPAESNLHAGDLVVPMVRHPDPVPRAS
jgi:glucose 1-dehydrogenase